MKLTFKREHIVPELKSTTSFQVIGELVEHLRSVGAISCETADPITLAVRQRESLMSTGLGFGVAIPHASTPLINEVVLAFGRSPKGIDFESPDGKSVRFVALLIVPAREGEKRFLALARVSRLLHGRDIRLSLEQAMDAASISNILNATQLAPAPLQTTNSH
jgi:mannitol/fructose-specific phosphotransferase system IIA component (Ntr-type)